MKKQDYLVHALMFFGVKIDTKVAEIIWELVPIIESKGGDTDLHDLSAIMVKVEQLEHTEEETQKKLDWEDFRFEFSSKTRHLFYSLGIESLKSIYKFSCEEIAKIRGYGKITIQDIKSVLQKHNLPPLREKKDDPEVKFEAETKKELKEQDFSEIPIEDVIFESRVNGFLILGGIETLQDLYNSNIYDLRRINGIGQYAIDNIQKVLELKNLPPLKR
jgi:DNA-directed RNA polymerase alpha subunit